MMQVENSANVGGPSDVELLLLLSDALDAGLRLLADGPECGASPTQVLTMLQGFADEASRLFASTAIEPSGQLFELAAQARTTHELEPFCCLSEQLHEFLIQAKYRSAPVTTGN